ncbi:FAD-dependent oxidoreductase [Allomesorhizobium camelthorni]|uniref:FAD-dependent oxidoreductase n=1 Tax=Allomesorhizobium camelthorni TaxID=475069 RepID=UPI001FE623AC|nr:FAD-dependent oxidoreductase [Mesorhizobium camelthorni]
MIIEQPTHRQCSAPAAGAERRRLQVIIVGAGFGGLTAARALKRATVDITLVDRRNHHLSQPLLYQVAAAGLSPGRSAASFDASPMFGFCSVRSRAWTESGSLSEIGARSLLYDMLIVATGGEPRLFRA